MVPGSSRIMELETADIVVLVSVRIIVLMFAMIMMLRTRLLIAVLNIRGDVLSLDPNRKSTVSLCSHGDMHLK